MGMFGAGFGKVLSGIGDVLAYGPYAGVAHRNMDAARQRQEADNRYRQAQLDEMSRPLIQPTGNGGYDVIDRQTGQVIRNQAGTPTNDTVNDFNFINSKLGPEAANQYLSSVAAGPPQIITTPDGRMLAVPRSLPTQRPAIGSVVPDPRKQGGASDMGSRTFP